MSEGQNPPGNDAPKDADTGEQKPPEGQQQGDGGSDDADPPGADKLGDAGKKALDAMKAERKAARDEANEWKRKLEELQAKIDGKEAEHAARLERERVQADALGKANEKILKAELRAAAAGKLSDPSDALLYIKIADFEVGDDGEVDQAALTAAVDRLIETKPYLAAQGGKRFQGGADGGPRNEAPGKSIDEEIAEAQKQRDWVRVIALKEKRAADLADAAKK